MNEYRCTRRSPYNSPNCPGHKDVLARQGYYFEVETEAEALEKMNVKFPNDNGEFDIQLWGTR